MRFSSPTAAAALAATGLALGTTAPLAEAQSTTGQSDAQPNRGLNPPTFTPIAGVRDLSGRLIARPRAEFRDGAFGLIVEPAPVRADGGVQLDESPQGPGQQAPSLVQRLGLDHEPAVAEYFPETDEYVLRVPQGTTDAQYAAKLIATGAFEYVEPDWIVSPSVSSNDPQLGNQWHHATIDSFTAWGYANGSGVKVAIVDSGVDLDHPDLRNRLAPGFNSYQNKAQSQGGLIQDDNGHGTQAAGAAAAEGNNAEGVAGVGWRFTIIPVKATYSNAGRAYVSDLTQGARWAADQGARVVNVSFAGVGGSSIETAGQYLRARDALLFWSAGNNGANLSGFDHPSVTVVGATTQSDGRPSWSNYGRGVDLFAPGVSIRTTSNGGGYGGASGTSFASPVAAGAAALLMSEDGSLSAQEIENALFQASQDLGAQGNDDTWGHGRINVGDAMTLIAGGSDGGSGGGSDDGSGGGSGGGGTPPPVLAQNDAGDTYLDRAANIHVLENDTGGSGPLSVTDVNPTTSAGGTVVLVKVGSAEYLRYTPPSQNYTGTDSFTYRATDGISTSAPATVRVSVVGLSDFEPAVNIPGGIKDRKLDTSYRAVALASLDDMPSPLNPTRRSATETMDYPSTNGTFADSGMADAFVAVFEGFIWADADDKYIFETTSDDGSRLFVAGDLVVDNDGIHGLRTRNGTAFLRRGWHPVRIELFDHVGGTGLSARYGRADGLLRVIDATNAARGCPGDHDRSGHISSADLLGWINDFRAGNLRADMNSDDALSVSDMIAFLNAFRGGC